MYVVIPVVKSKCGSRFEAHIAYNPGIKGQDQAQEVAKLFLVACISLLAPLL